MTAFLIRRLFQMFIVIILSSIASYGILNLAPGGPLSFLRERQNVGANRVTEEDIQRIRARFEVDLYVPYRFSRWLIGQPRGPITIGGQQFLADLVVGCRQPGQVRLRYPDGTVEIVEEGCVTPLTLADLEGRRTSGGILFGDFGLSQVMLRDRPISMLIESRLPYTLALMGASTLLAILIGVAMGVYSAVRQYSRFDYVMTTVAFLGASLPTFFIGIMAILLFAILAKQAGLPYLPPGNATAARDYVVPWIGRVEAESTLDYVLHFIMPCAVLTFVNVAVWSRFVRASMLEVLRQDYVRTARAKGVRERLVILKHSLRNALIPFVTLLANVLPTLFAGAIVTETIFNWPGMGRLLLDALGRFDYPVAMAVLFVTIVLTLIGYLLSDILYTVVDPRIQLT
ncbi:MAG TPA: ABC transporter permease [Roseiflexaceae bacterium]|nr:ABC transporter permease [Roseiflexaceae bacterium]